MIWENDWLKDFTPESYQGFVYTITHKKSGKMYIGKKNFWSTKKLPPLKGKKNRRWKKVETDWKDYTTSSPLMKRELEHNRNAYTCEIRRLCKNKSEMALMESYLILRDWHEDKGYNLYNEIVNLRVRLPK